ncbi:MAG: hypothetical protein LUH53_08705 [Lachnospiraceae bacterium]|nr:hypothetical protein [Lachnospiraceae bacterium]
MKKKFLASLLSMLLVFSTIPTITYATEMEVETVAAEAETEEETAAVVAETEAQTAVVVETETEEQTAADEVVGTDISTDEITESLENAESEISEKTEEDPVEESTDESDSEEDAATSMEEQTTSLLLGSVLSVAETEAETQTATVTEALCDHGNDAESCAVCALEEQIAALPTLGEIQTMTGDEEEAVYAQASALADVYYDDLTAEEQAQVSNIDTLWDILDYFSSGLMLTALSADTSWYNDTDTSFTITTASQLAGLASLVNAGTDDFSGKTIMLGNNINLNSEEWTPIGSTIYYSYYPFSGTFDGNGYTVSGLYISNSSEKQGLFGYISGATVKNLTVSGSVSSYRSVGGVVGYATNSTVIDCANSGDERCN